MSAAEQTSLPLDAVQDLAPAQPEVFAPEVEVRRSDRRHRTVSARLREGKLVVYLPARMSRAEEARWVETMLKRFEARSLRTRLNSDGDLQRRAMELNREYFGGRLKWNSLKYVTTRTPATAPAHRPTQASGSHRRWPRCLAGCATTFWFTSWRTWWRPTTRRTSGRW